MSRRYTLLAFVLAASGLGAATAGAGPIVSFTGTDTGVAFGLPLPNSNAAAAAFAAAVAGTGHSLKTIDFESAPLGTILAPLNLGGGVTLGVSNTPAQTGISTAQNFGGMFDTTPGGQKYFSFVTQFVSQGATTVATATFSFVKPVSAFGFYLTGLGTDELFTLSFSDGSSHTLQVPGSGNGFGSAAFYGFTDPGSSISSVSLTQKYTAPFSNYGYFVGVDDVSYAPVPEPATLGLLGAGLVALRARRSSGTKA